MTSRIVRRARAAVRRRLKSAIRSMVLEIILTEPRVIGPPDRLQVSPQAFSNNFLANTNSGFITIRQNVFFGKDVALITGTHDYHTYGRERALTYPSSGYDILIAEGAWIGTRAMIIGPCRVGCHAIVAAGSVVVGDVPDYTLVAGVPARAIRTLRPQSPPLDAERPDALESLG